MSSALKVLGLSGSYGVDSSNSRLVQLGLRLLEDAGAETSFWDLSAKPLPLVGAEGSWDDPLVSEFQAAANDADAYLVSSPEYHGCMSGVMKNQFDWIYSQHVSGKPFGLMSTLGGQSNSNTLNQMRICVRWIHAWAIPEQIAVPDIKQAFDEAGQLCDEKLQSRLQEMMSALLAAAKMLSEAE